MPYKLRVNQALDDVTEQAVSAGVDLWPRIEARAQALPTRARRRWLPASRSAWAGLALAALLLAGATAYAGAPVLNRLLTMDDQFRTEDAQRLGRTLNLSQTLGDVSVTVQWAYADRQRVLVGYTIASADGRRFDPGEASLSDARGNALHSTGGYGVTGHSDLLGVSLPPGQSANVAIYDSPAGLGAQTQSLSLQFHLTTVEYWLPTASPTLGAGSGQAQTTTAEAQVAVRLAAAGPFSFEFEVPVVQPQAYK
jgi:hypothetical protein